jgi:hypothetical protein
MKRPQRAWSAWEYVDGPPSGFNCPKARKSPGPALPNDRSDRQVEIELPACERKCGRKSHPRHGEQPERGYSVSRPRREAAPIRFGRAADTDITSSQCPE